MHARVLACFAMTLGCSVGCRADEAELRACLTAGSTQAQIECAQLILTREDGLMNDRFAAVRDGLSAGKLRNELKDAQRQWIQFRDLDCNFERDREGGGTLSLLAGKYCLALHTMRRASDFDPSAAVAKRRGIR